MFKYYWKYFLVWLFICGCVGICFFFPKISQEKDYQTYFAVLPHFAIQPPTIDSAYKHILDTYNLSGKSLQIVIISPDHFNKWTNNLYENIIDTTICFQGVCLPIHAIYISDQEKYPDKRIKEHGRWAHFPFLKKYFPQASISLIKLSPRDFSNLDILAKRIHQLEKNNNLLVIASVDFSHYTSEQRAYVHDLKSYYTLVNARTQKEYTTIEVDCPTCLYLVNTRAQTKRQYPWLLKRDSSSTIVGKDLGKENTSRAFILYTGGCNKDNGIVLWFFGDLIFDRWVKSILDTPEKIQQHFQDRYQQWNIVLNPKTNIHRKWFGLDLLGFNLETPRVDENCTHHTNGISFCSSWTILWTLQSLWFDTVTIANNHARDDWQEWYMQTIHTLQEQNISYAGWTHFKWINKNTVLTKTIRGIPLALHAYNLYNRFSGDIEDYCDDLKKYQTLWYKNIVSIHRGTEYQTTHNILQENIGKKLIDCWADIIIGHHPHVIQDIQRYQGKPIIYSLWNFLFDQYFSEATKKGMYVLAHIPLSWAIEIWTGEISSAP